MAMSASTSARYGPSRANRNIERFQASAPRPLRICTAARSAPPPLSEGSTKQTFGRTVVKSGGVRPANRNATFPRDDLHERRGLLLERMRARGGVSALDQPLAQRRGDDQHQQRI